MKKNHNPAFRTKRVNPTLKREHQAEESTSERVEIIAEGMLPALGDPAGRQQRKEHLDPILLP